MVKKPTHKELEKMKKAELIEYIHILESRLNAGRKEKFTQEQVNKIIEARNEGKSMREVAKDFDCSVGLVHKIINNDKEEGK